MQFYCVVLYCTYHLLIIYASLYYLCMCRRVYAGNSIGAQTNTFDLALLKVTAYLRRLGYATETETLTIAQARVLEYSVQGLVDWLLGSHIHFVITHPHQGMYSLRGSVEDIRREFARLEYHPGFPMGSKTRCPIYTQDKWSYLDHLSAAGISTMQSCRVDMPPEGPAGEVEDLDAMECQVRR